MPFGRKFGLWFKQQPVDVGAVEQAALPRLRGIEDTVDEIEKRATDVFERRHREVSLGAVDHFGGYDLACGLFEDVLAAVAHLKPGRNARREFDHLMVEE